MASGNSCRGLQSLGPIMGGMKCCSAGGQIGCVLVRDDELGIGLRGWPGCWKSLRYRIQCGVLRSEAFVGESKAQDALNLSRFIQRFRRCPAVSHAPPFNKHQMDGRERDERVRHFCLSGRVVHGPDIPKHGKDAVVQRGDGLPASSGFAIWES
ncbi:hypothetical protein VUR80DRAFT_1754 [Thermomyces stellatus]